MRPVIISLLFTLFAFTLLAQQKDSTQDLLLWQVSGNGIAAPSYLYGTFHELCIDDLNISVLAKEKLAACKQIFFEIDFNRRYDTTSLMHGPKLEKLIGKSYYKKLKEYLNGPRFTDSVLNMLKPYVAMRCLNEKLLGCPTTSIESQLIKLARKDSIPMLGLETPAEHILEIDNIPLREQADQLDNNLDNIERVKANMRIDIDLYNKGDIVGLYQKSAFNKYGFKLNYTIHFLDKRNALWIPVMEKAFLQKTTFFAFGCAHLVNETGIIALLIKKGYTITPMKYVAEK